MGCRPAPACRAVLDQATALWPGRSKKSDGICASAKHTTQNPTSDHEPRVNGYATAVDLTDDKAGGCDADAWAEHLRVTRDPRVKYVICNRKMWSSYPSKGFPAFTWRAYTGANPHESHTHVSILPSALFDTSPWFPEGDDMNDTDRAELRAVKLLATSASDRAGRIEQKVAEIAAAVERIAANLDAHRKAG